MEAGSSTVAESDSQLTLKPSESYLLFDTCKLHRKGKLAKNRAMRKHGRFNGWKAALCV
jgi:hypothetical protein